MRDGDLRGVHVLVVEEWTPEQRQWVFPTTYGGLLHYAYFSQRIRKPLLAKAKLPYRRYHATRHTFASAHLEAGADIRWV